MRHFQSCTHGRTKGVKPPHSADDASGNYQVGLPDNIRTGSFLGALLQKLEPANHRYSKMLNVNNLHILLSLPWLTYIYLIT